ncbi:hypothetical protein HHX47_DHR4000863 [Lentinula edodes]|nr:hypothetical protein HHX47_DHR4000863 [Lentinula edodes]
MDNAWQPQDVAPPPPSGGDMNGVEDSGRYGGPYNNGPRRSSRSRSPGGDNRDRDRDRGRRDGGQDNNPGNNLHVSGLSSKVDDRELEAMFAKVGRITKAQVVYDPHTRESRGFGFVTMETPEEADAAVTALNNTELLGGVGLVPRPLENTSGPPNAALLVTVPTTLGRTTRGILETGTVIMTDATEETVLDDMMIPDGIEIMINPEIEIEAVTEEEVTGEEVIEEGETATATMTVEIERKAGSEGATKYGVNSPLFFSSHKWFNLDGCMNELLFSLLISTI